MPATPQQELLDYAACDCVLPPGDAARIALWDMVSQGVGGDSSNILTEGGDFLTAENGDQFRIE